MDRFKTRLQELRIIKHRTQQQVASDLEYNLRTYQEYERGNISVPFVDIPKIARYFNVSADYFVGMSDEMQPQAKEFQQATGLSEAAIANLHGMKTNSDILKCLNAILESHSLKSIVSCILAAQTLNKKNRQLSEQAELIERLNLSGILGGMTGSNTRMSNRALIDYYIYEALSESKELYESIVEEGKNNGKC